MQEKLINNRKIILYKSDDIHRVSFLFIAYISYVIFVSCAHIDVRDIKALSQR